MKTFDVLVLALVAALAPPAFAKESIPKRAKERGSMIDGDAVVFVYDEAARGSKPKEGVEVRGSFTAWGHADGWALERGKGGVWLLRKPRAEALIPGNSGWAEFKFVVDGETWLEAPASIPRFADKFVVLEPGVTLKALRAKDAIARRRTDTRKGYRAYVQGEGERIAALTNFRPVVPDVLCETLYRSYHPFIGSRDYPVEAERLETIREIMAQEQINAVVCLSGDEQPAVGPYKDLVDRGDVLFEDIGYDLVYYRSDSAEMAKCVGRIARFLIEREPPYLVHCRLGTDRTGVVVAFLAAFAGAPLEAIVDDYLRSNLLGVEEYRDRALLTYALERMLGGPLEGKVSLAKLAARYLSKRAGLSKKEVAALKARLRAERE